MSLFDTCSSTRFLHSFLLLWLLGLVQWVLGLLYKHMARRWWIVLLQSVPFLHPLLEVTQFNISLEALKHYLSVRFLTFDDLFSCT